MKISLRSSRHGFAVIIALVAVAVLSILAGALAMFMKVENQLAQNGNDDEKLLWVGRAGVERACWILANEPSGPTSLKQIWAGGAGEDAETNSPIMGISLDGFPVGDGSVSLKLIEQESKINVNGADSQLLHQILTTMGADAGVIWTPMIFPSCPTPFRTGLIATMPPGRPARRAIIIKVSRRRITRRTRRLTTLRNCN